MHGHLDAAHLILSVAAGIALGWFCFVPLGALDSIAEVVSELTSHILLVPVDEIIHSEHQVDTRDGARFFNHFIGVFNGEVFLRA